MQRTLLVSDYDQTFYLNDADMENNKKAVSQFRKKGNIFIIATGRSYFDFYNKVHLYHFDYDYVIINHGATILDRNNNIIANFPIQDKIITKIKEDLHLEKTCGWFCCSKLESRVDFNHKDLTKINAKYHSKEVATNINKFINLHYSDYVHSYYVTKNSLEIISNETNKAKAIHVLLEKLNMSKEKVYTIGDGYSDIEMIKNFNGYAMTNSVDELKSIAKSEYKSVSELINQIIRIR